MVNSYKRCDLIVKIAVQRIHNCNLHSVVKVSIFTLVMLFVVGRLSRMNLNLSSFKGNSEEYKLFAKELEEKFKDDLDKFLDYHIK